MEYYKPEPFPPERKDRTLVKVLLAGCGFLVVIGIVFGILFARFFHFTRAPGLIVRAHLEAINKQDFELAYSHFSSEYQGKTSLEDFRMQLHPYYPLLPAKKMNLSLVKIVNSTASVDGTLTSRDGAIFAVHYELVRSEGEWKISTYEWALPGERQTI